MKFLAKKVVFLASIR